MGERLRLRATGARSGERPRGSRGPVFGRMAEVLSKNPAKPVNPAQRAGREDTRLRAIGARVAERPCAARMGRKCFLLVIFS
jgi:hypothetical protein